jgi:hypothetical protein
VAHPQTDGGRNINALTSFLFRNEAATFGAKDTDSFSSSFSVADDDDDGKRETIAFDTSSLFLIRNEAAAIAAAKSEEEEKQPPKGSSRQREAASTGSCTGRERARSRSVTEAGGKSSQGSQGSRSGRRAGYGLDGYLDEYGSGNIWEKQRTTRPRLQKRNCHERRSRRGAGAAAKPMSEPTEPTTQPSTNTRSSRSAGPPEKQPWTFGGAYWPSRK